MLHLAFTLFKSWKVTGFLFAICVSTLAVADATSNRELIYISLIGSGTTLLVTILNNRTSRANSRKLEPLIGLPSTVSKLEKNTDGMMQALKESREQTSVARQEVARGEGIQQERTEERGRQGDAALAKESAPPAKIIVDNPPDNPANVKTIKP